MIPGTKISSDPWLLDFELDYQTFWINLVELIENIKQNMIWATNLYFLFLHQGLTSLWKLSS